MSTTQQTMKLLFTATCLLLVQSGDSFGVRSLDDKTALSTRHHQHPSKVSSLVFALSSTSTSVDLDAIADVGYFTSASKPLGVIFGENPSPFGGLVVDDVEPGLAGGLAGLRVGDQLVAVDNVGVVGKDFDTVMDQLSYAPDPMTLQLYRGSARSLFTILRNRDGILEEDEEDSEEVIMDENYESPVRVNVEDYQQDDEPLTAGDVFNAFKKIGSNLAASIPKSDDSVGDGQDKKKGGGLFDSMFGGGETIQLDGDDANTLK